MGRRRDRSEPEPGEKAAPEDAPTFEQALERLEALVERLEQGDLELEAALASFEEGVALARRCAAQLGDAERRIEVLMREGGGWVPRPLDAPVDTEGE
jgi:exodeoxyribonuclease VII small subunit